jgi:ATP phosphoribosyltransferase
VETEIIAPVSSRLIVNRAAFKTHPGVVPIVDAIRALVESPGPESLGDAAAA